MTFGVSPTDSVTFNGRRTSGCILPRPPSLASMSVSLPSSSTLGGMSISYRPLQVSAVLCSISTVLRKVLNASAISLQLEKFSSTSFLSSASSSAVQYSGRCRTFFNSGAGGTFFSLFGFPSGTNSSKKILTTNGIDVQCPAPT